MCLDIADELFELSVKSAIRQNFKALYSCKAVATGALKIFGKYFLLKNFRGTSKQLAPKTFFKSSRRHEKKRAGKMPQIFGQVFGAT